MRLFGKPSIDDLAVEMYRSVERPLGRMSRSPIARWRRARYLHYLGMADYAEVLRAYYALKAAVKNDPLAEIVDLKQAPRRRLAA